MRSCTFNAIDKIVSTSYPTAVGWTLKKTSGNENSSRFMCFIALGRMSGGV